jgi:hypothetical protein
MKAREYFELFRYLMEQRCLLQEDIIFVENIAEWCRQYGIPETDRERPFRIISKEGRGCRMLIREELPEEVIEERINAMRVRGQLLNVAADRADMLDSAQKKLAYLFLSEYARSLPDMNDDLLADNWAFQEMERLGYFKK